eukprot:TRINITY_DN5389_c0_g1_i1.p1 TRINITY_DN5389_c0_g1~~TRINITY_DN5389_c0_g1_i1.p1  ORF type:complete len:816 (-),score=159.18 TRINITY_DN5389_c0_g1_i1:625-3072(-)
MQVLRGLLFLTLLAGVWTQSSTSFNITESSDQTRESKAEILSEPTQVSGSTTQLIFSSSQSASIATTSSNFSAAAVDSSLFQTLYGDDGLSTLLQALTLAGFEDTLKQDDLQYTIFAPTNNAFNRLAKDLGVSLKDLLEDKNQTLLTQILQNHLITEPISSSQLSNDQQLTSVEGKFLTININNEGGVTVSTIGSSANVITPDITAGKSIVHVVDEVLLPFKKPQLRSITEVAALEPELSTFLMAVGAANVSFSSDVFTIFAPKNDAFDRALTKLGITLQMLAMDKDALTSILQYHVVPGQRITSAELFDGQEFDTFIDNGNPKSVKIEVDGFNNILINGIGSDALVDTADIYASNAIIHIVDNVLLPTTNLQLNFDRSSSDQVEAQEEAAPIPASTLTPATLTSDAGEFLVDARENVDVNTFLIALDLAGIFDMVDNASEQQTVFVPQTDKLVEYINSLNLGTLQLPQDDLLAALQLVLPRHIIPGLALLSQNLVDNLSLTTSNGTEVTVIKEGGNTTVVFGDISVQILSGDIEAGNTVFHVVDGVLEGYSVDSQEDVAEAAELSSEDANIANTSSSLLDVLSNNDFLSLIFQAIYRVELEEELSDESSSFTLFAPTNTAFENLYSSLNTTLQDIDIEVLREILLQHVVIGRFLSSELVDGQLLSTFIDQDVGISIEGENVLVFSEETEARIQTHDISAGNSIIHVVDAVLLPGDLEVAAPTTQSCEDKQPPQFNCQQQFEFGKCNDQWMIDGEFCQQTCNRCPASLPTTVQEELSTTVMTSSEYDVSGCTCDETTMRQMIQQVMKEVLDDYFQ